MYRVSQSSLGTTKNKTHIYTNFGRFVEFLVDLHKKKTVILKAQVYSAESVENRKISVINISWDWLVFPGVRADHQKSLIPQASRRQGSKPRHISGDLHSQPTLIT
jgi:hypothetical protein